MNTPWILCHSSTLYENIFGSDTAGKEMTTNGRRLGACALKIQLIS